MAHVVPHESRMMRTADLIPHPLNARKHNTAAIDESIDQNGFFRPIIVSLRTGYILAGHGAWERAIAKNIEQVPVHLVDVDEKTERTIVAADNRTSDLGGYDDVALAKLLDTIRIENDGSLDGSGFTQDELDALVTSAANAVMSQAKTQAKELYGCMRRDIKPAPDYPVEAENSENLLAKWNTEAGQKWILTKKNAHTLYVGDARNAKLVADGICTDPPYELESKAVVDIFTPIAKAAVVMCGDKQFVEMGNLWRLSIGLVWIRKKGRSVPNDHRPFYHHTMIGIYTSDENVKAAWRRPHQYPSSVIECESEYEDQLMGQGKSPEVFQRMLQGFNWSTVADPFGGTGSTIIACEAQGRRCFASERDPGTAAVALERLSRLGFQYELEP